MIVRSDVDRPLPRLCRSRNGTFHRIDCTQATRFRVSAYPWYWAENKSVEEILFSASWNKPCKWCHPLDDWVPEPTPGEAT